MARTRTVRLTIKKCRECPHVEIGMNYSLDGWDRGNDWKCKKADRTIASFVERPSDEPLIPMWCPLAKGT